MYKKKQIENGIAKHIHKNVPFDFGKLMGVWLLYFSTLPSSPSIIHIFFYFFQSLECMIIEYVFMCVATTEEMKKQYDEDDEEEGKCKDNLFKDAGAFWCCGIK